MKIIITLIMLAFSIPLVFSKDKNMESSRRERGLKTLNEVTKGDGRQVVESLKDFPVLADTIIDFAYGDIISRKVLDAKSRQISTVSMLIAQGMLTPQLKVHFTGALTAGVTPEELAEVIYLTSVYAGIPKAINAATALEEVLKEKKITFKR